MSTIDPSQNSVLNVQSTEQQISKKETKETQQAEAQQLAQEIQQLLNAATASPVLSTNAANVIDSLQTSISNVASGSQSTLNPTEANQAYTQLQQEISALSDVSAGLDPSDPNQNDISAMQTMLSLIQNSLSELTSGKVQQQDSPAIQSPQLTPQQIAQNAQQKAEEQQQNNEESALINAYNTVTPSYLSSQENTILSCLTQQGRDAWATGGLGGLFYLTQTNWLAPGRNPAASQLAQPIGQLGQEVQGFGENARNSYIKPGMRGAFDSYISNFSRTMSAVAAQLENSSTTIQPVIPQVVSPTPGVHGTSPVSNDTVAQLQHMMQALAKEVEETIQPPDAAVTAAMNQISQILAPSKDTVNKAATNVQAMLRQDLPAVIAALSKALTALDNLTGSKATIQPAQQTQSPQTVAKKKPDRTIPAGQPATQQTTSPTTTPASNTSAVDAHKAATTIHHAAHAAKAHKMHVLMTEMQLLIEEMLFPTDTQNKSSTTTTPA